MSARVRTVAAGAALALALTLGLAPMSDAAAPGLRTATASVVTKVVGTGTPASCTEAALYKAVLTGGKMPQGIATGSLFTFQFAIVDPTATAGVALSNTSALTTP